MIVGERIKLARNNKNMSQQELGDLLGVSKVSICGYEKETRIPTMENFIQLLDILELNPDYLLGREVDCVNESNESYKVKLSNDDIKIIKEIKNNSNLYQMLKSDPIRTIELINRKLNK